MKNPLRKRYLREIRQDAGKYIALFLFLTLTIGFCRSGSRSRNAKCVSHSFQKASVSPY